MYISNTKVFSGMSEVYDRRGPVSPRNWQKCWSVIWGISRNAL